MGLHEQMHEAGCVPIFGATVNSGVLASRSPSVSKEGNEETDLSDDLGHVCERATAHDATGLA